MRVNVCHLPITSAAHWHSGCAHALRAAQEAAVLMPEQSEAKAKQILQQATEALGGSAYLNMRDMTCTGRAEPVRTFGRAERLRNRSSITLEPPTKDRTENLPQRNIIEVYNGDKGWTLDRGGVSEASYGHRPKSRRHPKTSITFCGIASRRRT